MTTTYREALDRAGVTVPDETIADLAVPVLTGPQRQGDVLIIPRASLAGVSIEEAEEIPAEGVPVVRGEATGNTHLLMTDRGTGVTWRRSTSELLLGVLTVPDGAVAHLIHTDEHGVNAIGPGVYELRGKREQAEEARRVQD